MSNERRRLPTERPLRRFNSGSSAASGHLYGHGSPNTEEQESAMRIINLNLNPQQIISEDRDDVSDGPSSPTLSYTSANTSLGHYLSINDSSVLGDYVPSTSPYNVARTRDLDQISEISTVEGASSISYGSEICNMYSWPFLGPDMTSRFPKFTSDINPLINGKKSIRLSARELRITWGDDEMYWYWKHDKDSRSGEVAVLKEVCWLEINGKASFSILSPTTLYAVYLVYKLTPETEGFKQPNHQIAKIEFEGTTIKKIVQLDSDKVMTHEGAKGWNQIIIGEFYNSGDIDGLVHVKLKGTESEVWKKGLIIEGMEFRAKSLTILCHLSIFFRDHV